MEIEYNILSSLRLKDIRYKRCETVVLILNVDTNLVRRTRLLIDIEVVKDNLVLWEVLLCCSDCVHRFKKSIARCAGDEHEFIERAIGQRLHTLQIQGKPNGSYWSRDTTKGSSARRNPDPFLAVYLIPVLSFSRVESFETYDETFDSVYFVNRFLPTPLLM